MQYWILKSEPDVFSFDTLIQKGPSDWDGVRNYQARNFLKLMKKGDLAFFYHTAAERKNVGILKIVKEFYQDPSTEDTRWVSVRVEALQALNHSVSIDDFKSNSVLKKSLLLRQSRLSVIPLNSEEFQTVLKLSQTKMF